MVIDASHSILFPTYMILSTPVSQSPKAMLPRVSFLFAETVYPSQSTLPEYMINTS